MAQLRLSNVSKVYSGGVQAVYDFNIMIEQGEFVVLVGPSGCGKTTVLRMIAGLETITKGDLYLGDARINNVAPSDRDISMVFQNYALYGYMSVYQNMGFSKIVRHENDDVIHESVMAAANILELLRELNRFPKHLSGGQRQRVALGRSIVSAASIILMDEPLSNLDAKLRVQARRELIKLHQQLGNTFIYVTHDQVEAMTMADRIVVMNGGQVQQIGTPGEVYHRPANAFVAGFIGSPPMNFFRGRVVAGRFVGQGIDLGIPSVALERLSSYQGKQIILGVRPEHFSAGPAEFLEPVDAEVTASEFLGDHSLRYLRIGDFDCIAKIKADQPAHFHDSQVFYVNMKNAHFFDPETDLCIHQGGSAE